MDKFQSHFRIYPSRYTPFQKLYRESFYLVVVFYFGERFYWNTSGNSPTEEGKRNGPKPKLVTHLDSTIWANIIWYHYIVHFIIYFKFVVVPVPYLRSEFYFHNSNNKFKVLIEASNEHNFCYTLLTFNSLHYIFNIFITINSASILITIRDWIRLNFFLP